jgi:hypothetical protein
VTSYDSRPDTRKHIAKVDSYLNDVAQMLMYRGDVHDASKLVPPELEMFNSATDRLNNVVYGTPEYDEGIKALGPALTHHYKHNSHHPEHYRNGISGMSLLDLTEMLMDWKASSERMADGGDIHYSIEYNQKRFGYSDELKSILHNTAREMDW